MFPDQAKRDKAEKIIQSATNQSLNKTNLRHKRPTASRKKQPNGKKNNNKLTTTKKNKNKKQLSTIDAKLNELTTLISFMAQLAGAWYRYHEVMDI